METMCSSSPYLSCLLCAFFLVTHFILCSCRQDPGGGGKEVSPKSSQSTRGGESIFVMVFIYQFSHIKVQSRLRRIGDKTSQTSVFSTPHVLQLLTSTDTMLSDPVRVDKLPSFAFRTALSAWRPWPGHQATKDLVLEGSPGPSQWAAWCSVVISTTSSALSLCTTMATRMAACSAPRARPSMESRLATSPQEKWSIMSSLTRYQVTLTAKPFGSFITSLRASRYSLAHLYIYDACL